MKLVRVMKAIAAHTWQNSVVHTVGLVMRVVHIYLRPHVTAAGLAHLTCPVHQTTRVLRPSRQHRLHRYRRNLRPNLILIESVRID